MKTLPKVTFQRNSGIGGMFVVALCVIIITLLSEKSLESMFRNILENMYSCKLIKNCRKESYITPGLPIFALFQSFPHICRRIDCSLISLKAPGFYLTTSWKIKQTVMISMYAILLTFHPNMLWLHQVFHSSTTLWDQHCANKKETI